MSTRTRTGRNQTCPCGSGRRYKHCCGVLSGAGAGAAPSWGMPETAGQLQRESAAGDAAATAQLGLAYLTARGVPGEPARGIELVDAAAAAGDPQGAALSATVRATSLWRERNWTEALNYLALAAKAGHQPSQDALRILAAGPGPVAAGGEDGGALQMDIDLDWWLKPPAAHPLRASPRIDVVQAFIPSAACAWLIDQVRGRLARATIYDQRTGGDVVDERRVNSQSDLGVENMGLLTFLIRARIAAALGRPDTAMEIPKVLHLSLIHI